MARIVKDADVRRDELLDAALDLFLANGYERTSVEQITQAVGVAKGTFYHYFDTKGDLLQQLVERFSDAVFAEVETALEEAQGSAIERFKALTAAAGAAKLGRADETLMFTRSLYTDDNRVLKDRMQAGWMQRTRPLMRDIIEQGVADGSFDVPDAATMTDVWLALWYGYGMEVARLFFVAQEDPARIEPLISAMRSLVMAEERILGAAPGSMDMGAEQTLRAILGKKGGH